LLLSEPLNDDLNNSIISHKRGINDIIFEEEEIGNIKKQPINKKQLIQNNNSIDKFVEEKNQLLALNNMIFEKLLSK
jgi:hypothetical protein